MTPPRIWMQLGCITGSRGFLRVPSVAIGAVKLQTVTSGCCSVTAKAEAGDLRSRTRHLPGSPSRPFKAPAAKAK